MMINNMNQLLGLLVTISIANNAILTVFAASYFKLQNINELENNNINFESLNRSKRNIKNLPDDAHQIITHNMRGFDVYGSSNGAYKVIHKSNNAVKIPGIEGNVTGGIISDKFSQQIYNIYFTVKINECIYQYYALKDQETIPHKISGLPDDAKLLSIHNLAGVIFFGSSNGAYELIQGELNASKISHANGNVVEIKLKGSAQKYDAVFITDDFNKCKYDMEFNAKLNKCKNELKSKQEEINKLNQTFEVEKDLIKIKELIRIIIKYNSLDPEQFLSNIRNTVKDMKKKLNIQNETDEELNIDIRIN